MGTLYRFRFSCQGVCYAIALGAFRRFFRPSFALSLYYKRTYANFTQKEMANIRYSLAIRMALPQLNALGTGIELGQHGVAARANVNIR